MKRTIPTTFAFACAALVAVTGIVAQPVSARRGEKKETTKAAKSTTRGADKNVKVDRGDNSAKRSESKGAPVAKGGAKTRGASFRLHVDNRTRYYIDIYTLGEYDGTVAPYGDFYVGFRGAATVTMYAKAPGTGYTWGPRSVYLDDDFTWTLTD